MPKYKQTPGNAFYHFMIDFKNRQGRSFSSMKEAADAAAPHWNRMTGEERRPFEKKALLEKNHMRSGKYTSDGLDVVKLERQEREEQLKIERMKEDIQQDLKMAEFLPEKAFFIIQTNIFCYYVNENRYYPAEIAIAKFSLQYGVSSVFHRLIKPGLLPLGYASEATLHSKETHQIAPPMADDTENNMEEVFNSMNEFLQREVEESQEMPILYSDQRYLKMVEQILSTWCSDYRSPYVYTIYDLQYFFHTLKNFVAGGNTWPSYTFSTREIEKDVYAYAEGISCDYHEATSTVWCSKSIVVRYAYVICDVCCQDLRIELIPGAHIPNKAFTTSSAAGFTSTTPSRLRSENLLVPRRSEWDNQSVTSETFTITVNEGEDFPSLESDRNQESSPDFTPNASSGVFSQSGMRSYAGAAGASGLSRRPATMPSSVMNSMEKLSVSEDSAKSADVFSCGRGNILNRNDFPALVGRGKNSRQSKGRGVRGCHNGQ